MNKINANENIKKNMQKPCINSPGNETNIDRSKGSDKMANLTPMMQQYIKTKEQYKDCILFYRLGDFYEMFFDDAITASKELEITLTGKDCGLEERAPMCGIPFHAVCAPLPEKDAATLGHNSIHGCMIRDNCPMYRRSPPSSTFGRRVAAIR